MKVRIGVGSGGTASTPEGLAELVGADVLTLHGGGMAGGLEAAVEHAVVEVPACGLGGAAVGDVETLAAGAQLRSYRVSDFAGLAEFIDSPVKTYSSGMFMRLGFSVAIATEPEPAPMSHSISPRRGASFARVTARISALDRPTSSTRPSMRISRAFAISRYLPISSSPAVDSCGSL